MPRRVSFITYLTYILNEFISDDSSDNIKFSQIHHLLKILMIGGGKNMPYEKDGSFLYITEGGVKLVGKKYKTKSFKRLQESYKVLNTCSNSLKQDKISYLSTIDRRILGKVLKILDWIGKQDYEDFQNNYKEFIRTRNDGKLNG
jgi:hypothetical protein